MKKTSKILLLLLMFVFILSIASQVFAATSLPSITSSKPITCYTINSSGKIYAYTAKDLKTKTGGYISCSTDECKILQISGNALQVKYPVSGGTKTAWFARSAFTSYDISKGAAEKWTQSSKITTYRRSDGKTSLGYISAGDVCYKLVTKGSYTQVIYPVSGGYKMGWIKNTASVSPVSKTKSLADVASNEVGYQGTKKDGTGKGDYTKYGKWIGADGKQWCASFVSWCVNQAGVSTKTVPKTALCDTMKNSSNSYKIWSTSALKNIKKNDVIFFANSSKASHSDHVGIVYKVSGSQITVIEGNTGNYYGPDTVAKITYTVDSNSGKITKGYSGKYFCGYISVN